MKKCKCFKKVFLLFFVFLLVLSKGYTQKSKPVITVFNVDTKGVNLDPQQMGNITRIELEKLDSFDVTDKYDVAYLIEKNKLNVSNCYGKVCLLEAGNVINSDYMLTGSVELYGEVIIATFRLLNVKTASVEKTSVTEFLNLPLEIQSMVRVCVRSMFGFKNDELLLTKLTQKFDYDNILNNPNKDRLNLRGPRFGVVVALGTIADRLSDPSYNGGYNVVPIFFQFGYQFEAQYLNAGNYQALFEFIPLITGTDQQQFIPSLTILNGFRNNISGFEIAVGPSFGVSRYADDIRVWNDGVNTIYIKESQFGSPTAEHPVYNRPFTLAERTEIQSLSKQRFLDSRGNTEITSAIVLAFGKSFKSGKMNIPMNLYFTIPSKEGFRVGFSMGYNAKR